MTEMGVFRVELVISKITRSNIGVGVIEHFYRICIVVFNCLLLGLNHFLFWV